MHTLHGKSIRAFPRRYKASMFTIVGGLRTFSVMPVQPLFSMVSVPADKFRNPASMFVVSQSVSACLVLARLEAS